MPRTGAQLLTSLGEFLADAFTGTTTTAGAGDGTTLVDTALRRYASTDAIRGWYLRPTGVTNQFAIRRISSFAPATGTCTVTPAFAAQAPTSEAYELHRFDPARMFAALDEARFRAYPDICQIIVNDTLTGDGYSTEFVIPTAFTMGPSFAFQEEPLSPNVAWNFLSNPQGNVTTSWTAASLTHTTVAQTDYDNQINKYDSTVSRCSVAASTNGTLQQAVAAMSTNITAARAAGREMTFAAWVYTNVAAKVRLDLSDDAGTTNGAQHGGAGWELLTATRTISRTNATTLTCEFDADNDANAVIFFWDRAWFYFGSASLVRDRYDYSRAFRVRRDDTTARVIFDRPPHRGRQLRLIGRAVLTALGTTASTQVTNSMEVDEPHSQLLVALAARILLEREGLTADEQAEIIGRIQHIEERRRDYSVRFPYVLPANPSARIW